MPAEDILSLFPLELVLLPGAELPLYIFELRYRKMVGAAAEDGSEFGVLRVESGRVERIGCTAVVEDITARREDGTFDVATRGVRRFHALELDQSLEILRAQVDYFEDEPESPVSEQDRRKLFGLVEQAAKLSQATLGDDLDRSGTQPSFQSAAALPVELQIKQQLLASRSEQQRIDQLSTYLAKWIEQKRNVASLRSGAAKNGGGR